MLALAMFMSVCGAVIVMSSAYVVSCTESGGSVMLLLFATTRSVFKSVKVSVVEIAKRTN